MSGLKETPKEIISRLYATLSAFGCGRWKASLIYAEALIKGSAAIDEDIRANRSEGAAARAMSDLIESGLAEKKTYADENIIVPRGFEETSFNALNAFEAFAYLVSEAVSSGGSSDFCDAGKSTEYPYHYFFSIRKHQYRIIVYGQDATARIGFFNGVYDEQRDKHYTTLLVVPDSYGWEEFSDVKLKGKTRIAFVHENNPKRRTYNCILTDVIEEI